MTHHPIITNLSSTKPWHEFSAFEQSFIMDLKANLKHRKNDPAADENSTVSSIHRDVKIVLDLAVWKAFIEIRNWNDYVHTILGVGGMNDPKNEKLHETLKETVVHWDNVLQSYDDAHVQINELIASFNKVVETVETQAVEMKHHSTVSGVCDDLVDQLVFLRGVVASVGIVDTTS